MTEIDDADVSDLILRHAAVKGALLPLLHDIQHRLGYIPQAAVARIAEGLNLSIADVHGVVTFYADFRATPPARRVVKLCMAEACQARGCHAAAARLSAATGLAVGETAADKSLSLEPIYCLGLCASGPAALVDDVPVARLAGARLDALAAELTR